MRWRLSLLATIAHAFDDGDKDWSLCGMCQIQNTTECPNDVPRCKHCARCAAARNARRPPDLLFEKTRKPPFTEILQDGVITVAESTQVIEFFNQIVSGLDALDGRSPAPRELLNRYSDLFNAQWSPDLTKGGVDMRNQMNDALTRYNRRVRVALARGMAEALAHDAGMVHVKASPYYIAWR